LRVKISTDHLLGRTDGRNGPDSISMPVDERASNFWANAAGAAGLLAAVSFLTVLGLFYGRGPGDAWVTLLTGFLALGLAAALTTLVSVGLVARSAYTGASEIPKLLVRAWRDSTNGWTMFLLGCALTLPAFALYTPTLFGDSDSARLIASILYVQRNGFDYLIETQEVLLPHILLSPIMAVGGIPAVQVFDAFSVVVLGGVVAFITWRLTRSPLAVLAGVLALNSLPAILDRAYRVPMYPAMLSLGFLGVYLSHRAIVAENRSRRWQGAVLAGLCLVLAFEAHQVGQLFLVVTALLVVTARPSLALAGLGRIYLVVVVLSIPRLVINVTDGGFSHFFINRVDFWLMKGYLKPIQTDFFALPVRDALREYVEKVPGSLLDVWGSSGLLVLALGLLGLLAMSSRLRRLALICAFLMLAVALYRRLPFYPRYFSLLLVGSALAAGLAFSWVIRTNSRGRRAAVALGLLGLLASAAFGYQGMLENLQMRERSLANGPYLRLAKAIPPGDGVIGTRSMYLNFARADVRTFGGQFLTEQEYVTFLTWPSEDAVIDLMRRHDIEWIFIPRKPWKWVLRYNNVWLLPNHGSPARYHREVGHSAAFCRARRIGRAALFKLDPQGAADAVGNRPRRCEASTGQPGESAGFGRPADQASFEMESNAARVVSGTRG
jgi:hypothetical protein